MDEQVFPSTSPQYHAVAYQVKLFGPSDCYIARSFSMTLHLLARSFSMTASVG